MPERLELQGVPERYSHCSLSNFKVAGGEASASGQLLAARTLCEHYVDEFLSLDSGFQTTGLLLVGPPGTGKTHLAVAVLAALVEKYAVKARFVDFTVLVHSIRSTFSASSEGSAEGFLAPIRKAEFLVVDELGALKPSPWISELLYLVINDRYAMKRPTLFTSNCVLASDQQDSENPGIRLDQRLPAPLFSRLYEMARPIDLTAVSDYRQEIGQHHVRA